MSHENTSSVSKQAGNNTLLDEGNRYYEKKEYAKAFDCFEKALQSDASNVQAYIGKGNCLRQQEQYNPAIEVYQQALHLDAQQIAAYNGICYSCLKLERYEEAMRVNQEALKLDDQNASAYNCKGNILKHQKEDVEALEAFMTAIKLAGVEDNLAGYYYNISVILSNWGNIGEAFDACEISKLLEPNKNKYDKYLSYLRECNPLRPWKTLAQRYVKKRELLYISAAKIAYNCAQYKVALTLLKKAYPIDLDQPSVYTEKGNIYLALQEYKEALQAFDEILVVCPNDMSALLGRATALHSLKNYDQAIETYNRVLQIDSHLIEAYVGKGDSYLAYGKSIEALRVYQEAIHAGTQDVSCYSNAGDLLTNFGDYEQALDMYEKALCITSQHLPALKGKANALFKMKNYQAALPSYQNLHDLNPEEVLIKLGLEDILDTQNSSEEANTSDNQPTESPIHTEADSLWSRFYPVDTSRSLPTQLAFLEQFMLCAPMDQRIHLALKELGKLYVAFFDPWIVSQDKLSQNAQALQTLFLHLPDSLQELAVLLIAQQQYQRIAELLIHLAPRAFTSLARLTNDVISSWDFCQETGNLPERFYQVLEIYQVSQAQANLFYARHLLANGHFKRGEMFLLTLSKQENPQPDVFWYLFEAQQHLQRSPSHCIRTLYSFIRLATTDRRYPEALKLFDEMLQAIEDAIEVIQIFQDAEHHGIVTPLVEAFRAGNWEVVSILRSHPHYTYPPVVVLDIESDFSLGASLGSGIFEIGAVRCKGNTTLETYNAVIRRDFIADKVAQRQVEAKDLGEVVREFQGFLSKRASQDAGKSIIIGHNIAAFDAPRLRDIGVIIDDEQIIDTLTLARLLHPDSLRHHLAILCQVYEVEVNQTEFHTALPDAHACAQLFYQLGESLLRREANLLNGIRALVRPESAFDRAILQPRNIPADPTLSWQLDPTPIKPHIITSMRSNETSHAMHQALQSEGDQLVEHADYDACYTQFIPTTACSLVTVSTRTRIERILVKNSTRLQHFFVLPHPKKMLCPQRLQEAINTAPSHDQKLHLFCLYQAAHNHDASTLYPLRLPPEALDSPELIELREMLIAACCASDPDHPTTCPAHAAVETARESYPILLSTHEVMCKQQKPPVADTIIIDDILYLQMHLAEYRATMLTSHQFKTHLAFLKAEHLLTAFETQLQDCINAYIANPGYHERLSFSSFNSYLTQQPNPEQPSLLTQLKQLDQSGEPFTRILEDFCDKAAQQPPSSTHLHAFWLDLWFDHQNQTTQLRQWAICGLSQNLSDLFQQHYWHPYKKHILAGTALTIGSKGTEFLERTLHIPLGLPYHRDEHARKTVYLPTPEAMPPAGFLRHRRWIVQVAKLLAMKIQEEQRAILITHNDRQATEALIQTFQQTGHTAKRQMLATQLNWTVTKINDRLHDPERRTLVFASPTLRQRLLDGPVDVEISGPLRFLNTRDPLVNAYMNIFSQQYPKEGAFYAYLLPQALLELKARLTSNAQEYIVCDGGLLTRGYRDDILELLAPYAEVKELVINEWNLPEQFAATLNAALAEHGISNQEEISEKDLHLILRNVWHKDEFRTLPPLGKSEHPFDQKAIVRAALNKQDQLVIAPTGGGKSLCFQLPAIVLSEEVPPKVTLVFSPLIALMSDQVTQLNRKGIHQAIVLNSTLSAEQRQEHLNGLKRGIYSLVYLAPEQIYSTKLREALGCREIGLIAIDEAHCLSQWGHNFRTDYFAIKKWIQRILCHNSLDRDFPILALTATARQGYKDRENKDLSDQGSTVQDIIEKLGLKMSEDQVVLSSTERPELEFHFEYIAPTYDCLRCSRPYEYQMEVGPCPSCGAKPSQQLSKQALQQAVTELKIGKLLALLKNPRQLEKIEPLNLYTRWSRPLGQRQRGLIYCAYKSTTEDITTYLQEQIPELRIDFFHAGRESAERDNILQGFISDTEDGLDIIVATNAFGMGIDVRRLGFVIHFDTPGTPEAYYQEAGRAGRDSIFRDSKERAQCILLFHPKDLDKARLLSSKNIFSHYEIEDAYTAICKLYHGFKDFSGQERSIQPDHSMRIFASVDDIASLAGVEGEQVATLLYYLEYHTTNQENGQPVLERGATASFIWRLKLEQNYQSQIKRILSKPRAKNLLRILTESEEYQLSPEQSKVISGRELADSLNWSARAVEAELLRLIRNKIITYDNHGHFKFNFAITTVYQRLKDLEKDLQNLFEDIIANYKKEFEQHRQVIINLRSIVSKQGINTVQFDHLTHFLFMLSQESAGTLRLLERCKLATRSAKPDHYEFKLWHNQRMENINGTIHTIFEDLRQTINVLEEQINNPNNDDLWHPIANLIKA